MATPEIRTILQRLLKDSDMTYDQLAEATGLGRMHAWRIINKDMEPEVETLRKLVEGMGSNLAEVFAEAALREPDLNKLPSGKSLSRSAAKADNLSVPDGPPLQTAFDRFLTDEFTTGVIDAIVQAIDRNSTAVATIAARLDELAETFDKFLSRTLARDEQAAKARTHKAAHRA